MRNTSFISVGMRFSLIVFTLVLVFTSCKKDSNGGISANEMTLTISGSSQTLPATTIVKTVNTTTGLKLYTTTGTNLVSSTVVISIASISLEKKTYQILPSITDIITGTNTGGVIASYTSLALTGSTTYSNANLNASGSIVITDVTSTYIKGTYDMVLVSSAAEAKALKGEFYSNITWQTK